MRSKRFFELFVGCMAATVAAAAGGTLGCGSDAAPVGTTPTSGGTGSSGSSSGAGGSGSEGSAASSSSSGAVGHGGGAPNLCPSDPDGNCSLATAEKIEILAQGASPTEGSLDPIDKDSDYYLLEGKKGQALYVFTEGKIGGDPFDPTYPDLVVTIYDSAGVPIAEDDDPLPRLSNDSEIYTVLPADGPYYLRVIECNAWEKGGPGGCSPAAQITNTGYSIGVVALDPALAFFTLETPPDNSDAKPDAFKYAKGQSPGSYVISTALGFFSDSADVDVYSSKMPMDFTINPAQRLVGYFNFLPAGPEGNGSTTPFGGASIVDAVTMKTVAIITGESREIAAPLTAGGSYLLNVYAPASGGDFAANPFYFVNHFGGGSNPVEAEANQGSNNVALMAEPLEMAPGQKSYFIDGDLVPALTDVDWFSMAVPAGMSSMSAACVAQRSGSGLRGFTASAIAKDASTILKTGTETTAVDLALDGVPVIAGEKVFLKLQAASQAANVSSTFYRCGVQFR